MSEEGMGEEGVGEGAMRVKGMASSEGVGPYGLRHAERPEKRTGPVWREQDESTR
jgi:hypothetical protein